MRLKLKTTITDGIHGYFEIRDVTLEYEDFVVECGKEAADKHFGTGIFSVGVSLSEYAEDVLYSIIKSDEAPNFWFNTRNITIIVERV